MRSLKDEIEESLSKFSDPMKQAMKNLGDNIRYAASDAIEDLKNKTAEEEQSDASTKEKGGCLKNILVYGFIIITILAFLKNGCSFNSTIERDEIGETTGHMVSNVDKERDTLYDAYIRITEANIAALALQNPIDTRELQQEYEFLLTCLVSEYMFKSMAHGHFTGEYETTKYDFIPKQCGEIVLEMKEYIDSEIVDSMYTAISVEAYNSFDDTMFNYDSCLVGTSEAPNIDAMWENYFDSLVGVEG